MSTPKMLTGVWKLETSTERVAFFKFHSALVIKTVLIFYLLSYKCVVISLNERLKFIGECNGQFKFRLLSILCKQKMLVQMFRHDV